MALAPRRGRSSATVLRPPRTPPVLRHPPALYSSRPPRTACFLGRLSGVCPAARGARPGTQQGRPPPGAEAEEEAAAAQPARGRRTDPLLVPRLSESLLFSYPSSIFDRPKSKIYFTADPPSPSESLGRRGGPGQRHAGGPRGAEGAAPAEASAPRTLRRRSLRRAGGRGRPEGRGRRCPLAEPAGAPPREPSPPRAPRSPVLRWTRWYQGLFCLTSRTRLSAAPR